MGSCSSFNMGFSFSFPSVGILWNLSSKDSLKEKLARESLAELTERVLIPLSGGGDSGVIQQSKSETDIFYNTTGCLRYKHSIQLSANDISRSRFKFVILIILITL